MLSGTRIPALREGADEVVVETASSRKRDQAIWNRVWDGGGPTAPSCVCIARCGVVGFLRRKPHQDHVEQSVMGCSRSVAVQRHAPPVRGSNMSGSSFDGTPDHDSGIGLLPVDRRSVGTASLGRPFDELELLERVPPHPVALRRSRP